VNILIFTIQNKTMTVE